VTIIHNFVEQKEIFYVFMY